MKKATTFEEFLEKELMNAIKDASKIKRQAATTTTDNEEEVYEVELELEGLTIRTDVKHLGEVMAALTTITNEVTK